MEIDYTYLITLLTIISLRYIVFIPLERLFVLRKEQKIFRRGWMTDTLHLIVNPFLVEAFMGSILGLSTGLLVSLSHSRFQEIVASQPLWLQFIEAIIFADLLFYIWHRMLHQIPFLWRIHSIHHSSEELDWLASVRSHPVEQIIIRSLSLIPIAIMGFNIPIFVKGIRFELFTLYLTLSSYFFDPFLHGNIRLRFGFLNWIFVTPQYHHWHHSSNREAYDKNFAGRFSFLDRIFGTLYFPKERPEGFGINDHVPVSYVKQLIYPFYQPKESAVETAKTVYEDRESVGS